MSDHNFPRFKRFFLFIITVVFKDKILSTPTEISHSAMSHVYRYSVTYRPFIFLSHNFRWSDWSNMLNDSHVDCYKMSIATEYGNIMFSMKIKSNLYWGMLGSCTLDYRLIGNWERWLIGLIDWWSRWQLFNEGTLITSKEAKSQDKL